jgi:tRNA uridine 5-carbamoylmethylation protein Kti12
MKLIFIYGPTAVGKYTVAKQLSKITGYKLLHNHLVNDMLDEVIDSRKHFKEYWNEVSEIKIRLVKLLAQLKSTGFIFTTAHFKNKYSEDLPKKMKRIVEKYGGKVCFVHLNTSDEELYKRIKGKSRKSYNKTTSVKRLKFFLKKYDIKNRFSFKNQLFLDTTKLSAKNTALTIVKHFKLSKK